MIRQHLMFSLVHQCAQFGKTPTKAIGDLPPFSVCFFVCFLRERGADRSRHHQALFLGDMGERIAHEVHAAALPCG